MDDLTKGLIEHLRKHGSEITVREPPQFLSAKDFHPIPREETMSTNNDRNEHFQGFARLLWEEMLSQTQGYYIDVTAGHIPLHHPEDEEHKLYIDLIAQRAYDLVEHALEAVPNIIPEVQSLKASLESIPDLTAWPTDDKEYCYSCVVEPRQAGSIFCSTCQQEHDDELQDHYDSHYT